jgi:hypothetical protein
MGKFIKNDGTKIPVGTVLFDGATQSDFTLTDDISNYDFYRSHNWVNPKSTRMSLKAGTRVHLSDVHTDGNTVSIYEMNLVFSGKNVTLSGCTKVIGGTYIATVEGTIYQVIGY